MDSLINAGGFTSHKVLIQSGHPSMRRNSTVPGVRMHNIHDVSDPAGQNSIHLRKNKDSGKHQSSSSSQTKENYENKHTLLVAEDEDINFMLIREYLAPLNYKVLRAETGKAAVEICQSNSDIMLVLMDMRMPTMNGFDATRCIKERRPELPIIAVTAYITDLDRLRARTSGCDGFLGKPFKRDQLIGKIRTCLNISPQE